MPKLHITQCRITLTVELDETVKKEQFDKVVRKFRIKFINEFGYPELPFDDHKQPSCDFSYREISD